MHSRVSVSAICSRNWSFDEDLAFYARAGITNVGLAWAKVAEHDSAEVVGRVREAGLRVTNLIAIAGHVLDDTSSWPACQALLDNAIDLAARVDAPCVVVTSGRPGRLSWEAAADAFATAIAPSAQRARDLGVRIAIEHTNSLRVDLSFVHSLRDAVALADRLDLSVCMECNTCWVERGVDDTIAAGIGRIALVQVSDFVVGTLGTPDRVVPGDGDIPLGRLLDAIVGAGYDGVYDLELIGPRIDDEGYDSVIPRAVAALGGLLTAAGVSA